MAGCRNYFHDGSNSFFHGSATVRGEPGTIGLCQAHVMLLKFVNGQQEIVRDLDVVLVQPKCQYQPGWLPGATTGAWCGAV
jgi:hypothetical protein